jgi:rhodanese-related sulfurtransferase
MREGKVKGAKMINYRAGDFEEQLELLDKDKTVFLYCRSGGRSGQAAAIMERMGFQHIVDMEGGMMAWQNEGLPIQK